MNFSLNLGAWNAVFAVPCALVDQQIKLAGALQLKVLLWALRHAGETLATEDAAKALGASPADINDAMRYWIETGLLTEGGGALSPGQASARAPFADPEPPTGEAAPEPPAPKRIPKPDGVFIAERIGQSEEIAFLMQESQQILGRPISPGLSSTLLLLHDDYGLPSDVILMLLQYVKSRGKDNTNYIEAAGRNWAKEGVNTHEKVEEKLRRLSEVSAAWQKVQQVLAMEPRSPSAREEQYASRWLLEWKFPPSMVREAYERCVNATGKLSFGYMNRILERWRREGVATPEDAAREQDAKTARSETRQPTYDLDEYERWSEEELLRLTKE